MTKDKGAAKVTVGIPKPEFRHSEKFVNAYANNVQIEVSGWDLKLIFGQLDQGSGKVTVEQHTAMTLPWATAKLFNYYFNVNVAAYELENGKIKLPPDALPVRVPPPSGELANNPMAKAFAELCNKMRDEFIAQL